MGLLIRLKSPVLEGGTALKSLKYGKDRPGEGDSGQPYVQTPIDQPTSFPDEDTILRGGLKAPSSALKDVSRLTKYFFDNKNPDGLLFIAKQNILSRISTKTEASGLFFNEGIYTPLSTLTQAGVGFTGAHFNKQILGIKKYQDTVFENNKEENNSNDGEVPLSLVRKSQRASNKAGRKLLARDKQLNKTANTITSNPDRNELFTRAIGPLSNLSNATLGGINLSFLGDAGVKGSIALENERFEFFQKWDQYIDNSSQRKFSRKDNAAERAFARQTDLYNQVLEEEAKVRYDNRLLNLWDANFLNKSEIKEYQISKLGSVLYSYGGGPDSILGIGKTSIKFATKNDGSTPLRTTDGNFYPQEEYKRKITYSLTNIFGRADDPKSVSFKYLDEYRFFSPEEIFGDKNYGTQIQETTSERLDLPLNPNRSSPDSHELSNLGYTTSGYKTMSDRDISKQEKNINSTTTIDFRAILPSEYANTFLSDAYTPKNNIETLFHLGNPGQRGNITGINKGKIINGVSSSLDKITSSPIYKTKVINGYSQELKFDDIIPFVIGILNNEIQDNTAYVKYMHFRAFIDNFSDGYNAEWKGIEYMGRAETFYKYQGFKRDMAVGFTIVAQSRQEQIIMYDKLNFLASSLAPEYLSSGYMTGNLAYLTLGDYISDQPGIINSLDFDISDDSPWETARNIDSSLFSATNNDVRRLPFMIKVKMKFTPIHKFRPEKETFKDDVDKKGNFVKDSTKLTKIGEQRFIDPNSPIQTPSLSNIVPQTQEDQDIIPEDNPIIDIIPEYIPGYGSTP